MVKFRMSAGVKFVSAFAVIWAVVLIGSAQAASRACHVQALRTFSTNCNSGMLYVGPFNPQKYGGYCVKTSMPCISRAIRTNNRNCGKNGQYVGAKNALALGGTCLTAAKGWSIKESSVN